MNYVGLGDSFSSGEGVGQYFRNTSRENPGRENYNLCHRSRAAYPRLLVEDESLGFEDGGFWACSGAEARHIVDELQYPPTQPAQAGFVDEATGLVTLTIGGNDIGFAEFADKCVKRFDCSSDPVFAATLARIDELLPANLARAYDALGARLGPQARVLVVSYPMVVAESTASARRSCGVYFSGTERQAARTVITRLNQRIATAVVAANERHAGSGPQFEFVDANQPDSPFIGHELCTRDSYVNGITIRASLDDRRLFRETFHPNRKGQRAYYEIVRRHLTGS